MARTNSPWPNRRNMDAIRFQLRRGRTQLALWYILVAALPFTGRSEDSNNNGLVLTFASAANGADSNVVPNIALFVKEGTAPTPFVAPGKFTAVWEGQVSAE